MKPLLSEATYASLLALREGMLRDGLGPLRGVMLPVGAIEGDGPRVLWVGQALRGGKETTDPTWPTTDRYAEWVPGLVAKPWPFWQFIRQTMKLALGRHLPGVAVTPEVIVRHMGWSNLALLETEAESNPAGPVLDRQVAPCAEALRETIATMRPTAVVTVVNKYAPGILEGGTGATTSSWRPVDPAVRFLKMFEPPGGPRVFWTKHPRTLRQQGIFDAVASRLAQEL